MIRNRLNNHRPWNQALFALVVCTVLGSAADRAAADPSDLEVLNPRHLRPPSELGQLQAVLTEFPIIIGPFPGNLNAEISRRRHFTLRAATPRGPRTRPRRFVYLITSAHQEARSARTDSAR